MRSAAFAAHRAAASGLFTLFTLLAIVLGQGDSRLLALTIGGALGSLFLLTRPSVQQGLGVFAAPLAIVADLGLLFCAMSLTGGALSPYALLLPAGVALSWHAEGKPAARFFAIASLLGVAALVTLGDHPGAERRNALHARRRRPRGPGSARGSGDLGGRRPGGSRGRAARRETAGGAALGRRAPPRAAGRARLRREGPRGGDPARSPVSPFGHPRLHRPDPGGGPAG